MQTIDGQQQGEGTKIGGFAAGFFGGLIGALLVHFLAKSPVTKKFAWIGLGVAIALIVVLMILSIVLAAASTTTAIVVFS